MGTEGGVLGSTLYDSTRGGKHARLTWAAAVRAALRARDQVLTVACCTLYAMCAQDQVLSFLNNGKNRRAAANCATAHTVWPTKHAFVLTALRRMLGAPRLLLRFQRIRSPWMPTCRTLQTKLVRFIGNCTVRWIQPIQSNLQHRRRWDVALCQCQLWHMYVATPPPLRVRLCRLNAFVSRLNSTARTSDREGCAQRPLHACCTPSAGRISWQQYSSNCSRPITADREVPGQ